MLLITPSPPFAGDPWWVMHFSVSIKIKVESQRIRKCCRYADQPAGSQQGLRGPCVIWFIRENTATLLHPPPRGTMQILDQVPQDNEEPIWGSAGSFKLQTAKRKRGLNFVQQQSKSSNCKTNKLKVKQRFHLDHSGARFTARREKLLYLSARFICMSPSVIRSASQQVR